MENTKDYTQEVLDGIKGLKDEIKGAAKAADIETVKSEVKGVTAELESLKKQVNAIDEKAGSFVNPEPKPTTMEAAVAETIKEGFSIIKDGIGEGRKVSLQVKSVQNMDFSTVFSTANVSISTLKPEIVGLPNRPTYLRSLMGVSQLGDKNFVYVRENAGEGGPAAWVSGTKPTMDVRFEEITDSAKTIAATLQAKKQMFDDLTNANSYVPARMMNALMEEEDRQILYGSLTSEIDGIAQNATGTVVTDAARSIDRIVLTMAGLRRNRFISNFIIVDPVGYAELLLNQGTDKAYSYPVVFNSAGQLTLAGVPVIQTDAIAAGKFLVGDFSPRAVQFLQREAPIVQFFEQNGTNVEKNEITLRIEERVLQPIYFTGAFAYGDLGTFSGS